MSVAPLPPSSGEWTPEEYDALPEDGYRRELIDGVLHVAASPSGLHQLVGALLTASLHTSAPPRVRVTQGVEIKLSPKLRYIPDVLAVTAQAYGDGCPCRYDPADVLAVEVVSDSSRSIDRLLKPHHYAAAGIPFHWRVELEPRLSVSTFMTGLSGEYEQTGTFDKTLSVTEPWPVDLDLTRLPG